MHELLSRESIFARNESIDSDDSGKFGMALSELDFDIQYRKGSHNENADSLWLTKIDILESDSKSLRGGSNRTLSRCAWNIRYGSCLLLLALLEEWKELEEDVKKLSCLRKSGYQ